jgi:hypothetical protein
MPIKLQLSMPYQARVIRIDSDIVAPVGAPVQVRELRYTDAMGGVR